MEFENLVYYKNNNLLIYPKKLSGQKIITNAKQKGSKISYETSKDDSTLKIDINGLIYIEEIEKYNIECTDNSFKINDFRNIGDFHAPNLGTLQYINYVGITKFSGLRLFILNKKIKEEEYQSMVKEIEEKVIDLIFDFNKPTYISSKTNIGTTTLISYHSFRLLLFLLETEKHDQNIYKNLDMLLRNIHKKIDTEITTINFNEVGDMDDDTISSFISESGDYKYYNNSNIANNSLIRYIKERSGKDLVPDSYKQKNVTFKIDNHENKFIKFFIMQCILILEFYKKKFITLSKKKIIDFNLIIKINKHINRLNYIINANPINKVSDLSYIPFESQVLTKQDGYRQIFKSFLILKSRHSSLFNDDINQFIDAKSLDKVYELWCFFELVGQLEVLYSTKSTSFVSYDTDLQKTNIISNDGNSYFFIKGNAQLPSLKVYFKKSFSFPESYSQLFDPDITVEVYDEDRRLKNRILFDAKFKFDMNSGVFKSEDINKMHTYLDAISKSYGSYILYPGMKNQRFLKPNSLIGVGAFTFKPHQRDNTYVREVLLNILQSLK